MGFKSITIPVPVEKYRMFYWDNGGGQECVRMENTRSDLKCSRSFGKNNSKSLSHCLYLYLNVTSKMEKIRNIPGRARERTTYICTLEKSKNTYCFKSNNPNFLAINYMCGYF